MRAIPDEPKPAQMTSHGKAEQHPGFGFIDFNIDGLQPWLIGQQCCLDFAFERVCRSGEVPVHF